jgi:hypothetical protein
MMWVSACVLDNKCGISTLQVMHRLFSYVILAAEVIHQIRCENDNEWCIGQDLEGTSYCLHKGNILTFAWRD